MWLVWFDKKRNTDVDAFICVLFISKNTGTWKKHVFYLLTKMKGRRRDRHLYQCSLSNPPALAGFGASMVLSTIVLPGNYPLFTLFSKFKKVESPDPENATDFDYDNTCNIYRIYDLNISDHIY